MSGYLFAGPSLPKSLWPERDAIHVLTPVAQGDLLPLIRSGAMVIGIIDGVFEAVPAVLHKEILYALSRNIVVVGGASMGALRAAELQSFGMIGIGSVFQDYASGRIEDDDEVAVLHGPAETGYLALSDAMVDIRATLAKANREGVLDENVTCRLLNLAKGLHYRERRFDRVLNDAVQDVSLRPCVEHFGAWLENNRVQQKKLDAIAVVEEVRLQLAIGEPPSIEWQLQWTDAFDLVVHEASAKNVDLDPVSLGVLDEIRLRPADYVQARDRALLRGLARKLPLADSGNTDSEQGLYDLFAKHGLYSRDQQLTWIAAQHLNSNTLTEILDDNRVVATLRETPPLWCRSEIIAELRLEGGYAELAARAEDKNKSLGSDGGEASVDMPQSVMRSRLVEKFLRAQTSQGGPLEQDRLIRWLGFADRAELGRILWRDHLYNRQLSPAG